MEYKQRQNYIHKLTEPLRYLQWDQILTELLRTYSEIRYLPSSSVLTVRSDTYWAPPYLQWDQILTELLRTYSEIWYLLSSSVLTVRSDTYWAPPYLQWDQILTELLRTYSEIRYLLSSSVLTVRSDTYSVYRAGPASLESPHASYSPCQSFQFLRGEPPLSSQSQLLKWERSCSLLHLLPMPRFTAQYFERVEYVICIAVGSNLKRSIKGTGRDSLIHPYCLHVNQRVKFYFISLSIDKIDLKKPSAVLWFDT